MEEEVDKKVANERVSGTFGCLLKLSDGIPVWKMIKKTAFAHYLESEKLLILDGGLSNQLEDQGNDLNNRLWSASLLKENEGEITKAHQAYLDAGANCIISSSYQASILGFMETGIDYSQACDLIKKSVELGRRAIEQYMLSQPRQTDTPLLAASIGPYGASLSDGSEYRGNYGVTNDVLVEFHRQRLEIIDGTSADILACETIPSMQEAAVLKQLLQSTKTPAWVSFSCKDGQHISDGTSIEEAIALLNNSPTILAVGVNCTAPQYIKEILHRIKLAAIKKAIVVYPNSGEQYDSESKQWYGTVSPDECAAESHHWKEAGAKMIGGCCRMGPEHIKKIKRELCDKV